MRITIDDKRYDFDFNQAKKLGLLVEMHHDYHIRDNVLVYVNKNCENFTIPKEVTIIGQNAFLYCTKLTNIIIPDGVTDIGHCAFNHCVNLTRITIPDTVVNIGRDPFYGCFKLTHITIGGNSLFFKQRG
jgi:hypothetical protein